MNEYEAASAPLIVKRSSINVYSRQANFESGVRYGP
jgi:hypothetical protein